MICALTLILSQWARELEDSKNPKSLRASKLHRQRDRELRSFAFFALHDDLAAHEINKLLHNRQTQARAAVFARRGFFRLLKFLEDMLQSGWIHADSGVRYCQL